jgi:hypothetical protein
MADGIALIPTVCDPLAEHPAPLTAVTPNVTAPVEPAVKAIVRVPAPDVIEPLVIDQV